MLGTFLKSVLIQFTYLLTTSVHFHTYLIY